MLYHKIRFCYLTPGGGASQPKRVALPVHWKENDFSPSIPYTLGYSLHLIQPIILWHNSSWRLLSVLLKIISQNSNSFRHSYQGTSYLNEMSKNKLLLVSNLSVFGHWIIWVPKHLKCFFCRIIKDLNHIFDYFGRDKKVEWNFEIIELSLSVTDFMTSSRTWTQLLLYSDSDCFRKFSQN